MRPERHANQKPDHHRKAKQRAGSDQGKGVGAKLGLSSQIGESSAARRQQREAARDVKRAQCGDEGRDGKPGDQQTIDHPHQNPDQADDHDDFCSVVPDGVANLVNRIKIDRLHT